MKRINDYTKGNLLDNKYFSTLYKVIAIDLTNKIEL